MFHSVYEKKLQYYSLTNDIPQDFIKILDMLFGKIYSNVEKIVSLSSQISLDELINDIKNSFEITEEILFKLNFEDEFHDFSSIKNIAFYILDNHFFQYVSFINDLISSFQSIIQFKMELNDKEYLIKYSEFTSILMDIEQKFYTTVYSPSENYNEKVLSNITNSLFHLQ